MGLLAVSARHPTADVRVLTHETGDRSPQRLQAAVDLGLVGVSLLLTWTSPKLR